MDDYYLYLTSMTKIALGLSDELQVTKTKNILLERQLALITKKWEAESTKSIELETKALDAEQNALSLFKDYQRLKESSMELCESIVAHFIESKKVFVPTPILYALNVFGLKYASLRQNLKQEEK